MKRKFTGYEEVVVEVTRRDKSNVTVQITDPFGEEIERYTQELGAGESVSYRGFLRPLKLELDL